MNHRSVSRCLEVLIVLGVCLFAGCALPWPNPNIGERTSDLLHHQGKYDEELAVLRRHAGEPWAQLRLGMSYQNGHGVKRDYAQALEWYLKAALQHGGGRWAEGAFLSVGKTGYYGMNYDAASAQLIIADMYVAGTGLPKDLVEASLWACYSLKAIKHKEPKYWDESGEEKPVSEKVERILRLMTNEQRGQFERQQESWTPQRSALLRTRSP